MTELTVGTRPSGHATTYVIAEAGVNHNGSLDNALRLIDVAAESGADAVKFQTFKSNELVSKSARKADYQLRTTGPGQSQLEMLRQLELSIEDHHALVRRCRERCIEFLSTPFDVESLEFLVGTLAVTRVKISSGDATNAQLLVRAARLGKPVILSTGMCTLDEVELALGALAFGYTESVAAPSLGAFRAAYSSAHGRNTLKTKVTLLHCTTEYPAPFSEANLRAIDTMAGAFGLPVGLSDHTPGISVPIAAVARGATVIEKHFTLDKSMQGPDHAASLAPAELKSMLHAIREVELALGDGRKVPAASELKNREVARRSLVARRPIRKGELFTEENLTVKRPSGGLSPMQYWDWLGKTADQDYAEDSLIR